MQYPGKLKVADERILEVTRKPCPVWVDPFSFAVMPGTEEVVILGNPTVKVLGIDAYEALILASERRFESPRLQLTLVN